jgi:hypothetical protein
VLLVVLGISLWFQKHVRVFAGVAAILLALVSIPVSNLGGFLIGFLLALIGGAMAVSWAPGTPSKQETPREDGRDEEDPFEGVVPSTAFPSQGAGRVGEPNDLSGTSPANGANGRHSAG